MNRILSFFSIIIICAFQMVMNAQQNPIATLTVNAGNFDRYDTPVGVIVEELMNRSDTDDLLLYEVSGEKHIPVICQVERGATGKIWWIMDGYTPAGTTRNYEIISGKEFVNDGMVEVVQDSSVFRIFKSQKEVLNYQYAIYPAPEGADDFYSRSGFIHPLYSPGGNVLTRIQPPDHLHHYGIWNPWTKVKFQKREVDFWNLGKGQGTVRYAGTKAQFGGAVFGGFRVKQEHVDLTSGKEIIAINEILDVRVWNTNNGKNEISMIDITSSLNCAGDDTLFLEQYRYGGGIGFRATQYWNKDNSRVETSAGKSRKTADATKAAWCNISGQMPEGSRSGILFLSYPDNRNHPEPMRVWPEDANNGRGDMFFEFCPIRDKDWILIPGEKYILKYRLLVYDGEISTQLAKDLWTGFAYPPDVKISYKPRVLVYTKNGEGYVHDNIPASINAIQQLGKENGFLVDVSEDPADFTREKLSDYQCLIFSNTNNQVFDTDEQRLALVHYIEAGGGFVGIHSACGSERNWPWFWAMLGGKFYRHPPFQEFDIRVIDHDNPATGFLDDIWKWEDECYYLDNINPDIHVLLAVDLTTIDDPEKEKYPGKIFGELFPLAWYHKYDGGRQFYSALGHKPEHYSDQVYIKHILGGITWVLEGITELDYSRTHTDSLTFDKIDKNQ